MAQNIITLAQIMRSNVALRLDKCCREPVYGLIINGTGNQVIVVKSFLGPKLVIYRLELLWKDCFCMQQVVECNLDFKKVALKAAIEQWLQAASIMMTLKVHHFTTYLM